MRTLIHLLIVAIALTASTATYARALEDGLSQAAAPSGLKLASGGSGLGEATGTRPHGLQLTDSHQEIGRSGGATASGFVVLVHNTCLANATRLASGSADELVDLYRAVSPNEFDDIFRIGGFRPHPGGRSLGAKQFGRNLDEVVELARGFPDAAAVVHVRVPARLLQRFDLTPVDSSILRAGSVTVHEELLGALNRSIVGGVRHAF